MRGPSGRWPAAAARDVPTYRGRGTSAMARTNEHIDALRQRIGRIQAWYHRIDLGDGVETPGHFRMADYLAHYHFPARLDGMRVLDVGASTGFFAYEFEQRGAAEVVCIELPSWNDHDWTPRQRRELDRRSAGERQAIDRAAMHDGFALGREAPRGERG